ncbi:MAG: hypothetical protein NT086_06010 [Proteobacteria bacterium]|nr:hypothetical protein [Pseudomonadota bacterium]
MKQLSLVSLSTLILLSACGGGSGGGAEGGNNPTNSSVNVGNLPAPTGTPSIPTNTTPEASPGNYKSLTEVKVAGTMKWQLSSRKLFPFTVKYSNNSIAAGVVIKLFTYTTEDPHANTAPSTVTSTPSEPVALALIDSVFTDSNGQASWEVVLANAQTSVLAIISDGTQTSTQIIQLNQAGPINLTL